MQVTLDHILWAAPDRDRGMALFERVTGVAPAIGGSHPGFGSRNALASLSDRIYLEILAPDPAQDLTGTWGADVAALPGPQMYTLCLGCDELEAVADRARNAGVTVEPPIAMSRTTPEGQRLDWRIMRLRDARWPGRMPFFIDWQGAPHPGGTTPPGCSMSDLCVLDPNPEDLRAVFDAIGCDVPVYGGACFGLVATLQTPKGQVLLT
ncbi:MAG: VOC family protein [Sulfitobacter sp.]|nr:VOC family protein [Sulfitobacter sp.]